MNSDYSVLNQWLEQNFGFQVDLPPPAPMLPALKSPPKPWSLQQQVIIPTDGAIRPFGALWEQLNRPLVPAGQAFDLSSVARAYVDFIFNSRFTLDSTSAVPGRAVHIRDIDFTPEEVVDIAITQIVHASDEDPVWRGEAVAHAVGPQTHMLLRDAFYALWQAILPSRAYILGSVQGDSRVDQVAYAGWRGLDLMLQVIVTNPRSFHPHVD